VTLSGSEAGRFPTRCSHMLQKKKDASEELATFHT
jgi:hypothetical protein